jgi:hypothetical protein
MTSNPSLTASYRRRTSPASVTEGNVRLQVSYHRLAIRGEPLDHLVCGRQRGFGKDSERVEGTPTEEPFSLATCLRLKYQSRERSAWHSRAMAAPHAKHEYDVVVVFQRGAQGLQHQNIKWLGGNKSRHPSVFL